MSAKSKGNTNGGCQGKDSFERMNFLYQASSLMAGKHNVLSCYYGNLMKMVAKKSVLRIHPEIKRTLCKRCGLKFNPGSSVDIDIIEAQVTMCHVKCAKCGFIKKYRINADYKLWVENPESVVNTIKFNSKSNQNNNEKGNKVPMEKS